MLESIGLIAVRVFWKRTFTALRADCRWSMCSALILAMLFTVGATNVRAQGAPSMEFRVVVDNAPLSAEDSKRIFVAREFGNLKERVMAANPSLEPQHVARSLIVQGPTIESVGLDFQFDAALSTIISNSERSVLNWPKEKFPNYGSLGPYIYAGARFAHDQIPLLLDSYGQPAGFGETMDIVNSPAFWRTSNLRVLAVAICQVTSGEVSYGMKLLATVTYDTDKALTASVANIRLQCRSQLGNPAVRLTSIELRYETGEERDLVRCEGSDCGNWSEGYQ